MISEIFPAAQPQDPLVEVLPNLYLLRGSIKLVPGVSISRNMVVVRKGRELTLIGSVRMTPENEALLEQLGDVTNVVRIGGHGQDDAYTVSRFGARFWCLSGTEDAYEMPVPDEVFDETDGLPFLDAELHQFNGISAPEVALIWRENGGVLITCDALQHYGDWRFFNGTSRFVHRLMGFSQGMIVGPAWHRLLTMDESALKRSFARLVDKDFAHMVGLHGTLCRDVAKNRVQAAMKREFDEGPAMPDLAYKIVRRMAKVD
jgi:hypothetical protein